MKNLLYLLFAFLLTSAGLVNAFPSDRVIVKGGKNGGGSSGIYIPSTGHEKPQGGVVIAPKRKSQRRSIKRSPTKTKPLKDRVIVKGGGGGGSSGIIIPDTANERPQDGVVLAKGHQSHEDVKPVHIVSGQHVSFNSKHTRRAARK